jgi:hypothetical protein
MKMNTNVSSTKKGDIDAVIGTAVFPFTNNELWDRANHPYKFAPHCINLDDFRTEDTLKAGNKIEEIHSFLGWKQKYVGAVKSMIVQKVWSMHTHPVGWGPFPLPHFVEYSFNEISPDSSQLSIRCEYKAGGLLSLPIARSVVRKIMQRAVGKLLIVPEMSSA